MYQDFQFLTHKYLNLSYFSMSFAYVSMVQFEAQVMLETTFEYSNI